MGEACTGSDFGLWLVDAWLRIESVIGRVEWQIEWNRNMGEARCFGGLCVSVSFLETVTLT